MSDQEAKIVLKGEDQLSPAAQQATLNIVRMNQELENTNRLSAQAEGLANRGKALNYLTVTGGEAAEATKNATQAMAAMEQAAGGSAVSLTDLTNAFKNLLREVVPGVGRIGSGTAIALAAGTFALYEFGKASAEAATRLQEVQNRAQVVFGSDFPQVQAATRRVADEFHRSATEILGFQTQTTAIVEGLGLSRQAAEQMSQALTPLAIDIGKVFNVDDAEAMHAIESALEGNTRALREYGIVLNDGTLQEYAHAEGIKVKVAQMDAESKAVLTAHYLMDKTHDLQVTAAKDTGDVNDALKGLHAEWQTLEENLGTVFVPVASAVLGTLKDWASWANTAAGAVGNFITTMGVALHDAFGGTNDYQSLVPKSYQGSGYQEVTDAQIEAFRKGKGLTDSWMDDIHASGGGGGKKDSARERREKELESLRDKILDLRSKYFSAEDDMAAKTEELAGRHNSKIESMKDKLKSLQDQLDGVSRSSEDALNRATGNVTGDQDKLAELQLRAYRENQKGSVSVETNDEIAKLQKKLAQDQAAVTNITGQLTPAQLADAAKRGGMTAEERTVADNAAKAAQIQADIAKQNTAIQQENDAYKAQQAQIENTHTALLRFHDGYVGALKNMTAVTKNEVDAMTRQLESFARTISKVTSGQLTQDITRKIQLADQGSQ